MATRSTKAAVSFEAASSPRRINTRDLAKAFCVAAAAAPVGMLAMPQVAAAVKGSGSAVFYDGCAAVGYTKSDPGGVKVAPASFNVLAVAATRCASDHSAASEGWVKAGMKVYSAIIGSGSPTTPATDGAASIGFTFKSATDDYPICTHLGYAHKHIMACIYGWTE